MKKRFAVIPLIVIMMLSLMAGVLRSPARKPDGNGEQEASHETCRGWRMHFCSV